MHCGRYLSALPQELPHLPFNWPERARRLLDGTYLQHVIARKEVQYHEVGQCVVVVACERACERLSLCASVVRAFVTVCARACVRV